MITLLLLWLITLLLLLITLLLLLLLVFRAGLLPFLAPSTFSSACVSFT
jgi:hypothetical protein